MKSYPLFGLVAALTLAALLAGCTDPESHPLVPPPQLRDGPPLDMNATVIAPASDPYRASGHWIIPPGRTVTILPGTEIMFDSLWWVDVQGRIVAEGTSDNPIVFTSAYLIRERGQWRGIKLRPGTDGKSVFKHCIFTFGAFYDTDTTSLDPFSPDSVVESIAFRGMLCVYNSSPVIEHCVVYRNQNNAVSIFGANCAPRIRYNIFTDNDASAVRADTLVPIADFLGETGKPDVSFNCVADNSSIPFIYGRDSTRFGRKLRSNANRDSVDFFYNLNESPQMVDQVNGDFRLTSCSPCVDAGPVDIDHDPEDGTRADMGSNPYVQLPGELRGVLTFDTLRASTYYRISCNCMVDSGRTLYVEPGTQIGVSDLYSITVNGRIIMNGTEQARIRIQPTDGADKWDGILITRFDTLVEPSVLRYADFSDYQNFEIRKAGTQVTHCGFDHGVNHGLNIRTFAAEARDSVSIRWCTFQACGAYGVRADSSAVMIRNSLIEDIPGRGISLHSVGSAAAVTNCIIRGCGTTGLYDTLSNPLIINNTIGENAYYGLHLYDNCRPTVLNNIFWGNGHYGIYAQLSSTPVLQYNNVWGHTDPINGEEVNTDYIPSSLPRANSISTDALFFGPDNVDYPDASPCHDAGDPRPEFNDADGSVNDMGAFGGPMGRSGIGAAHAPRGPSARLALK